GQQSSGDDTPRLSCSPEHRDHGLRILRLFEAAISSASMKRLLIGLLLLVAVPAPADEVARLHALFDRAWEARLRENPLFATSVGRHEYDDRLPSMTLADLERRNKQTRAELSELRKIDRAQLPPNEVVNYDMFRRNLRNSIESYELGDYQMPFNADSGFHTGFSRLPQEVPLRTTKDYENYI